MIMVHIIYESVGCSHYVCVCDVGCQDRQYKQTSHVDQLAVHFVLDGNMIYKDSDEARRQMISQDTGTVQGTHVSLLVMMAVVAVLQYLGVYIKRLPLCAVWRHTFIH